MLFFTLNIIPIVLGKTRNAYLVDFLFSTEIEGEGFKNGIGAGEPNNEATAYALEILDYYGRTAHDDTDLETYLETELETIFDNGENVLYELYYLLKSLDVLDYSIEASLKNRIHQFINGTEQISGGFSLSNTSTLASMSSTYFVVQVFDLIEEPIPNKTVHKNWVLSCNNSEGGYGGNQSLSSTLASTYYAASILDELGAINDLVDKNKTLTYLKSFYVDDSADLNSFGGYLPDEMAQYALLSSTFFCVKSISLIDPDLSELNRASTMAWVLARQYFEDGGFAENSEGYEQKVSSVISSYYGFETLRVFNALSSLAGEIWMVEFNFWILGIVLMSIGIIIALIVFLWRKRRI